MLGPYLFTLLQADPNRFNGFLVLGYVAMFLVGIAYVLYLANVQRNVEQDIKLMQRILQEDEISAE